MFTFASRPRLESSLFFIVAALAIAIGGPARAAQPAQVVAEGNNAFAVELYAKLQSAKGNLFFSPYSISTALAMTYAGACGNTEKQMAQTLHFGPQDTFHAEFGTLQTAVNETQKDGKIQLNVANSLWIQKDYPLLEPFLNITGKQYAAKPNLVDFVGATEPTRKQINAWVEEKTKDRIKDLIQSGVLDAATRMVLANAIYFKGNWAGQFKAVATKDEPFQVSRNEKVDVSMMQQRQRFACGENEKLQVLVMPYVGDELAMVVLLPRKVDGLSELEADLTIQNLKTWTENAHKREVQVYFPRFKMTYQCGLKETLTSLGMPAAFDPAKADFSGMTGKKDLFISAVIHKAFVEVNEEGTEAAAATALAMALSAMPAEPPVFRADHPFLFLIRHNASGSILFMGRVINPKP